MNIARRISSWFPADPEYRAGRRAAYDLARRFGVRRRTVRRIIREARPVQDWADVRRRIAAAAGGEW